MNERGSVIVAQKGGRKTAREANPAPSISLSPTLPPYNPIPDGNLSDVEACPLQSNPGVTIAPEENGDKFSSPYYAKRYSSPESMVLAYDSQVA